jgi:phage baseplate assembly protein W
MNYQPALSKRTVGHPSGLASDRLGEVVSGVADIDQCITIIFTTPKGSDPHRPTFGSDLYQYIDYPIDAARPHFVREVVDALRLWEPRISVLRVRITPSEIAELEVLVEWVFADGVGTEIFTTPVPIR